MKIAVWIVFALLSALWTGGALLVIALSEWAAQLLASGDAAAVGTAAAQWPVPAWVSLWLDPASIKLAQEAVLWALSAGRDVLPMLGSAMGWLEPLIWLLWLLGMVLMLVLAIAGHLLLGRLPSLDALKQRAGI
ncbi:hypothetical protein HNP55_004008 [Paucibacter oligotrophus]|uniref:Uncharacterized protein n=1 Tax=Roseateles oligotrophus TaxID=1769250 RepID=A0A840LGW2_9BURK|nr:hypothetical protein [Roseateles oligotrophus]MBB4845458.1 hypothetical protein [Roseateles oligotrophus]